MNKDIENESIPEHTVCDSPMHFVSCHHTGAAYLVEGVLTCATCFDKKYTPEPGVPAHTLLSEQSLL